MSRVVLFGTSIDQITIQLKVPVATAIGALHFRNDFGFHATNIIENAIKGCIRVFDSATGHQFFFPGIQDFF
jgi:hypothetical protein